MSPLVPDLVSGQQHAGDRCPANLSGLHVHHEARVIQQVGARTRAVFTAEGDVATLTTPVYRSVDQMRCRCGEARPLLGVPDGDEALDGDGGAA